MSPFRGLRILLVVIIVVSATGPSVHGHTSTGPIFRIGTFAMSPQGNFRDASEQMLADLGIQPFPGDTLRFAWTVTDGNVVYFDIHTHSASGDVESLLTLTADAAQGNWTVPGTAAYGIFWRNLSPAFVNVSYRYEVIPHDENETLVLAAVIGVAAATVGMVAWTVLQRRRESQARARPLAPAQPESSESGPSHGEPP